MKNLYLNKSAALIALAVGLVSLVGSRAHANLVIDSSTTAAAYISSSSDPSASTLESSLKISASQLGSLLYGADIGNNVVEAGPLTGSYQTTTGNDYGYPIQLTYTGGLIGISTYLVVKDGSLGSYVYDLGRLNWDNKQTINVWNLFGMPNFQGQSVTSNNSDGVTGIEFFGTIPDTAPQYSAVPEPSTIIAGMLLLLPLGVSTYKITRKRVGAHKI